MNITQESDYAIRAVLILANQKDILDAKTIGEKGNIPLRFLLKLLRKLTSAGIVKSYRGVNGGYVLNRLPRDINLKIIIEAIEGPITINRCLYDKETCSANKGSNCCIHKALYDVQSNLIRELESVNFETLLDEKW